MTTIVTPMHGCMHDDIEIIPITGAVHCTNCGMWWYDADADMPTAKGRPLAHPNTCEATSASANASQHRPTLNPDNEPTSETNQWKETTMHDLIELITVWLALFGIGAMTAHHDYCVERNQINARPYSIRNRTTALPHARTCARQRNHIRYRIVLRDGCRLSRIGT